MNVLMLGPVGSGKTTQARLLADYLGIPLLNAGDLLFYASQEETPEADEIRKKMEKGELVESSVMHKLIEEHLKQAEHEKGTLVDGHPRTLEEAKMFSLSIDRVVYIKISDNEARKRLMARGRIDDKPDVILKRLEIYHNETEPVLDYYRKLGILEEIDGERGIDAIAADIQSRFVK